MADNKLMPVDLGWLGRVIETYDAVVKKGYEPMDYINDEAEKLVWEAARAYLNSAAPPTDGALYACDALRKHIGFDYLNNKQRENIEAAHGFLDMIIAALSQPVAREWLPIETAPKDCLIDIYTDDGFRFMDCSHDHICNEWRSKYRGQLVIIRGAKYWMPLPAAPEVTG